MQRINSPFGHARRMFWLGMCDIQTDIGGFDATFLFLTFLWEISGQQAARIPRWGLECGDFWLESVWAIWAVWALWHLLLA